jgi:hypothetical protein
VKRVTAKDRRKRWWRQRKRRQQVASDKPKSNTRIAEQYSIHPVEMIRSVPWRVLSRAARQFLDLVEVEVARHGGSNVGVPVTYEDAIEYGIVRSQIAPAQREVVTLGFLVCTDRGCGGNAEHRSPNRWRVTYLPGRSDEPGPTHDWRKFASLSLNEAKEISCEARAAKDPHVVATAIQRNRNRCRKPAPIPVRETNTESARSPVRETSTRPQNARCGKPTPLSSRPYAREDMV